MSKERKIHPITVEDLKNRCRFNITLSKERALERAPKRTKIFQIPNGAYLYRAKDSEKCHREPDRFANQGPRGYRVQS